MEKELKAFLKENEILSERGFVRFKGNYYLFNSVDGEYVFLPVSHEHFPFVFRQFAEERLAFFFKRLEGFIHNTNGKITPVFSRLGLISSKIEEAQDLPQCSGVNRVFQKIFNSVKEVINIHELLAEFLDSLTKDYDEKLNIKRFFDGFHHAFTTDRELKHKVYFSAEVDENLEVSVNKKNFTKAIYFLGESFFAMLENRDVSPVALTVEAKEGNSGLVFNCEIKPYMSENGEDLPDHKLKSLMYFSLFEQFAPKAGIEYNPIETGIEIGF